MMKTSIISGTFFFASSNWLIFKLKASEGLFTDACSLGFVIHQDSVLALVNKLKRYSIG